jgi:hypothetical protein
MFSRRGFIKTRPARWLAFRPHLEFLEERLAPTGNITITNAFLVDSNDQLLTAVHIGEAVYVQANFTTQDLPSTASYRVGYTVNGLTLDSGSLNWGAGSSETGSWYAYWGSFLATPGTNQVTVTVDPDHSVAETSYADNTLSFTFEAFSPVVGSLSYTVAQIRAAYGINSIPNFGSAAADGSGQTMAIVDAYNDPSILTDLDGFDQAMSLTTTASQTLYQQYGPASSFLTVYNQSGTDITASIATSGQNGVPGQDPTGSSEVEETLDVEWAHAIAPGAHIDLIECNGGGNFEGLFSGAATAAELPGVTVVSMSWSWSEGNWSGSNGSGELAYDANTFVTPSGHPGITFLASIGDGGTPGGYPALSPNVVAVGGTELAVNNDTYGSESGWSFPIPRTLNNGGGSYSQTGSWTAQTGGFSGSYSTAAAGSDSAATWSTSLSSSDQGWVGGTEVSATWMPMAGNATNATYQIYDGTATTGTLLATVTVDQTKAPVGIGDDNTAFQELGDYYPQSGTLTVVLSANAANGTVVADAVGIAPAWATGGGQSQYEPEPAYQNAFQNTGYRTTPDVSFDASDESGVTCYQNGGFGYDYFGTSLSSPCWAGLIAIADQGRVANGSIPFNSAANPVQTLQALYSLPASDFYPITSGYNGILAGAGYDEVTGRGSPIANLLIPDLVNYGTYTVNSLGDTGQGSGFTGDLRYCLTQAGDGAIIRIGVQGVINLTSALPDLTHDIRIEGPGQNVLTLDGGRGYRLFTVDKGATVEISGLSLANGNNNNPVADDDGGAIRNDGTLTIDSCTLSGNDAGESGGAIFNAGTLSVSNSMFLNDLAANGDGGALANAGTMTVSNCTFSGNATEDAGGGAIYNSGTLTISGSTLSGNAGAFFGGAIDNTGSMTVSNSTLTGNSATLDGSGGGIFNAGPAVNQPIALLTLNDCTIAANRSAFGGGIDNAGTLNINSSTISGNSSGFPGSAGGIANFATLTVRSSTITGNTGGGLQSAGGIANFAVAGSAATVMLLNCTIADNTVSSGPQTGSQLYSGQAGMATGQATIEIFDTIIAGNGNSPNLFADVGGSFISDGHNLSSDAGSGFLTSPGDLTNTDPLLGPLQDNGGPTQTMALLPGSPAVAAGDPTNAPAYDQRGPGFPRIVDGTIDMGAFQTQIGAATQLVVSALSHVIAGSPFDVTVTALDAYGRIANGYTGTITFTSSDTSPEAVLPANYTFTSVDAGVHTFTGGVTLVTAAGQMITVTDTANSSLSGSVTVSVAPAAATQLVVTTVANTVSGVPFDVTVMAVDPYGNTATTYQGTITFSTTDSDPGIVLPAAYTFTASDAGVHTFSAGVILITPGNQTVTVTDNSGLTGNANVMVTLPGLPPGGGAQAPGGRMVGPERSAMGTSGTSLPVATYPMNRPAIRETAAISQRPITRRTIRLEIQRATDYLFANTCQYGSDPLLLRI